MLSHHHFWSAHQPVCTVEGHDQHAASCGRSGCISRCWRFSLRSEKQLSIVWKWHCWMLNAFIRLWLCIFRSWLLPINSQIAWFVPYTFKARTRCHFDVFNYLASWTCTGHVTSKASRKHSSDACFYGHVIPMAYSRHPALFMPSRLDAGQDLLVPPIMCPNHLNTGNHMQLKWDSKQISFHN